MKNFNEFPLLQIKMVTPLIKNNLVHRNHLIDRIEKGIEYGFVLVSAPPGYGKPPWLQIGHIIARPLLPGYRWTHTITTR